jgi:Ca-activated chloride channel family protein
MNFTKWARWFAGPVALGTGACVGPAPDLGTAEAGGSSAAGSDGSSETGEPAPRCVDPQPLDHGDAPWNDAPFEPPGDMGQGDGGNGGWDDGGGFLQDPDGGGVSVECDGWAQDCPAGEKCMPWANDGKMAWNATKCSPLAPDAAMPGEACTVEGSPYSGVDDCDITGMCWEPDESLAGTCIAFCAGSEANPSCPPESWCFIGYEGVVHVCLPDALCGADGVCRCMCPSDPDCVEDGRCEPAADELEMLDRLAAPPRTVGEEPVACPDSTEPLVLYMSNDDSNSQASPTLARRAIHDGGIVPPGAVRIHEFLNYYDVGHPSGGDGDAAAEVALQMRRTDAAAGEFTLAVSARGRDMAANERPALNVVFSLDTSGSMGGERIELLRSTVLAAAHELRAGDVVSVVTWSTEQQVLLAGHEVAGPDDPELVAIANAVQTGGGTDLDAGLDAAYELAEAHRIDGGINRVVLVSDGGANAGVTAIDVIASGAKDGDGEGIYLVGVGVGDAAGYSDGLMDAVTDAGKGAYVFVDSHEEAARAFGPRFVANMAVAARNVRLQLTLPWYFGIKKFHGEEYSPEPSEVEPQHLAPNDTMTFHQIIGACDASQIATCDEIRARVEYVDPLTGEPGADEVVATIGDIVVQDSALLRKADAIVGYAKSLVVIGHLANAGHFGDAAAVATHMSEWTQAAATDLGGDPELAEIASLLATYATALEAN